MNSRNPYRMEFDVYTIKHLGLQMYSTLPSVIGELVANCWDANATEVKIQIPEDPINEDTSEITIQDNGLGMSDKDVRRKYFRIGRDRREGEQGDETPLPFGRKVMGRKGIGKFSAFGISKQMEVESVKDGETSRFQIKYDELLKREADRAIEFPPLEPTGDVPQGTKIVLRQITKFRNRHISIGPLRRRLARRFTVIGSQDDFEVLINGTAISPEDRDLQQLLERDMNDDPYLWEYKDCEIVPESGWVVSGWIGALDRTTSNVDNIDRGIALIARGKLVQEPFMFDAGVGQQYALSYLIGELHVEFVDGLEDTVGTSRNSLVWETEANTALKEWGKEQVNRIAREWAEKRRQDNERHLHESDLYRRFREDAERLGKGRALGLADKLVRQTIESNPVAETVEIEAVIQTSLDFLQFDAFWELVSAVTDAELGDTAKLINLFREWQIVEAKEMSRVTEGRITTIAKFQELIDRNAMEVPTLHKFLKEFPWVIDPRWTLIDDEVYYSKLLREKFPESDEVPESDRRIDFLCVRDSHNLVVVEIKRPLMKASRKELVQIEEYVIFLRGEIQKTTDPEYKYKHVMGYLVCGDTVDTSYVRERRVILEQSDIYIRLYRDLLANVKRVHRQFLERYNELQEAKESLLETA